MKYKIYKPVLTISAVFLGMITLNSCTKGFEDINTRPDQITLAQVTIPGVFNGISKNATAGVGNLEIGFLWDIGNQQAVQSIFSPYFTNASLWNSYYPVLYNYRKLLALIAADPNAASYSNVKYMASILVASKTLQMLDYYGDIPYSTAGAADSGGVLRHPVYDKQSDVYKSVLDDLNAAANGIAVDGAGQTNIGNAESFLGSDYAAWVRFANGLRLRYAVRLYGVEQATATAIITDIIGGNKPLPSNQAPAALAKNNFGYWPANLDPVIVDGGFYRGFAENSISKLRMSSNLWAQMSSNNNTDGSGIFDPRCKVWFEPSDAQSLWVPQPQNHLVQDGGDPYRDDETRWSPKSADAGNLFAIFNMDLITSYKYFPTLILTESDVDFLKAEIYQRGLGVSKDIDAAKAAYTDGITSSVNFWYDYVQVAGITSSYIPAPPTDPMMTAFLNQPSVAYDGSDDGDALKKIATQAWISAFWEPWEAWAIVRRTGLTPKDPSYTTPVINKMPYPDDEKTNNFVNWQAASGGATPDQQATVKPYWMP
jgi:hypothetical protein